jgi:hypothetical protein
MGPSSGFEVGGEQQNPTKVAARIAEPCFGAIGRRQMLARGVSAERVRSWQARGLLHPRYPGVYAWGRRDLGTEGELAAALLYAGTGAALGSLSALWWRELLGRRPARIHVDAPGYVASHADIAIRHPREIRRETHRGLPVVPLPAALLAASAHLSRDALRLILARAEFHRLVSLRDLHAALGPGRPGTRAVRAALSAHLPQLAGCANGLEREFLLLCEAGGIELPEPNVRIGSFRPDMLWREAMLIVELDGHRAHSTPAQRIADARRQRQLEAGGFRVLRFGPTEVRLAPGRLIGEVRAALVEAMRKE